MYLQQSYKGIPVYNKLKTLLAFRGGKVVSDGGETCCRKA
ncbi:MAG: hypothetical protein IPQ25_08510 [Chitinophagaceae bacterium]|nr:hypothetical protein [Chitinophagaceae bacterium]